MNYNRADLANLYEQVQGKEVPDNKHLQIYGEGTSEDHKIADRNDVGYKDVTTGEWKFERASNGFIEDIMIPEMGYANAASYLKRILLRGQESGVIGKEETINSWKVKKLFNYIKDSVGGSTIVNILKGLPDPRLQQQFKDNINNGTPFNFYDLINSDLDSNFKYNSELDTMRPAGEDQKTRGAAGPGEALLAFLYNGVKPQDAGDLQLGSDMIELKKIGGRIGKDVNVSRVKELQSLFNALRGKGAGALRDDKREYVEKNWKGKTLGQFLEYYSGVDGSAGPGFEEDAYEWLIKNNREAAGKGGGSTYDQLVQWTAAMQMSNYFNKIAKFDYLVVFRPDGKLSGFSKKQGQENPKEVVSNLRKQGIYFGNKEDKDGHQIYLIK